MRIKVRVHVDLVPGDNRSYPGGAAERLRLMGMTDIVIPYVDGMPIYGDVTPVRCKAINSCPWVSSLEVMSDGFDPFHPHENPTMSGPNATLDHALTVRAALRDPVHAVAASGGHSASAHASATALFAQMQDIWKQIPAEEVQHLEQELARFGISVLTVTAALIPASPGGFVIHFAEQQGVNQAIAFLERVVPATAPAADPGASPAFPAAQ